MAASTRSGRRPMARGSRSWRLLNRRRWSARPINPICSSPTPTAPARRRTSLTDATSTSTIVGGDQAAPRGVRSAGPIWSADGKSLLVVAGVQGDANLVRVDAASGSVTNVVTGKQTVQSYSATADGKSLVAVISTQTTVGDLFAVDLAAPQPAPNAITDLNHDLFTGLSLSTPEEITWTSFDGRKIQGWIMRPPDFDASRKYPMILQIHGGPHSAYGNVMTHEFQVMAARGYVVLFANPRGSSNYGQDFGNIIQFHYPGDDYRDLIAAWTANQAPYIGAARLSVTGARQQPLRLDHHPERLFKRGGATTSRTGSTVSPPTSPVPAKLVPKRHGRSGRYTARSPIARSVGKTPVMPSSARGPANAASRQRRDDIPRSSTENPGRDGAVPERAHELSRSARRHRIERLQHHQLDGPWLLRRRQARTPNMRLESLDAYRFAPSPTRYASAAAHRTLQLFARTPARRDVRPSHRRHRRGTLVGRHGHGHPRQHAVAGPHLG